MENIDSPTDTKDTTGLATPLPSRGGALGQAWRFYRDGFRNMPRWGRILWAIIVVKLLIMFLILKPFFFPSHLASVGSTEEVRSDYVAGQFFERSTTPTQE